MPSQARRRRKPSDRGTSAGIVRRTNTNVTIISVSTSTWVSARSGAPWKAKITATP